MKQLIFSLAILLSANVATACSCAQPPPTAHAYAGATAVFVGNVVEVNELRFGKVITLRVIEAFKGATAKTLTLNTGSGGGDCGFPFMVTQSYLVYAHGTADNLGTNICSRSKSIAKASLELSELRKLRSPVSDD
jgi:hypothetical protein